MRLPIWKRIKKIIGNKHTPYDTLKKGFPSHLGKDIEKIAEELIKKPGIVTTLEKFTNFYPAESHHQAAMAEEGDLEASQRGRDDVFLEFLLGGGEAGQAQSHETESQDDFTHGVSFRSV